MAKAQIETEETTGTPETSGQDIAWLRTLEEKVHAAAGRIRELRDENAGLRQRIDELEARLATPASDGAERWTEEREEIRGRVERLVEHLEELL